MKQLVIELPCQLCMDLEDREYTEDELYNLAYDLFVENFDKADYEVIEE